MCSLFSDAMEKDGDLADIVLRASGGGGGGAVRDSGNQLNWSSPNGVVSFPPPDNFGNPFSNMQDPLHEAAIPSSGFFNPSDEYTTTPNNTTLLLPKTIFDEDLRRPTNNIFSRMLQISPNNTISPSVAQASCSSAGEMITSNTSIGSAMESIGTMQISSSRNLGMKRRKNQAKKVVCIPAPAAANSSKPSGEVVPSDLWAWRKYGQKPIKGSPYPRGYYRCSSSKGCLARKQVERSRTDPNMLVITYSSEHNHPWPTQRNALAGSTRSQPSKGNAAPKTSTSQASLMDMDGHKESLGESTSSSIKEEFGDGQPIQMDSRLQPADDLFFADLEELEHDPLNLLLSNEHNGEKSEQGRNKGLDPFSLFDWAGNNMFEENKKGGL